MRRLSSTVIGPKTRRPSGTCAMPILTMRCGDVPSMRSPQNEISPDAARLSPEIVLSSVVLPAPLAPMSATTSPSSTVSDTRSSACADP